MEREYDIFEQFPDGSPLWRTHVRGLPEATRLLKEIAAATPNECFAVHLPTKEIVGRLNLRAPDAQRRPLIFQIGYESDAVMERAALLRAQGYEVVSAFGNEAARLILQITRGPIGLFIVGCAGSEETGSEAVAWLKANYPTVPVLALNSPDGKSLSGADYSLTDGRPGACLPTVAAILGPGSKTSEKSSASHAGE